MALLNTACYYFYINIYIISLEEEGTSNKKSNTSGMPCKPKKIHIESVKVAAKKCKNLLMEENEGETKIYEFLEYLSKS